MQFSAVVSEMEECPAVSLFYSGLREAVHPEKVSAFQGGSTGW